MRKLRCRIVRSLRPMTLSALVAVSGGSRSDGIKVGPVYITSDVEAIITGVTFPGTIAYNNNNNTNNDDDDDHNKNKFEDWRHPP